MVQNDPKIAQTQLYLCYKTQTTSETAAVRSKLTSMWHSVKYGRAAFAAVSAAHNDQGHNSKEMLWLEFRLEK